MRLLAAIVAAAALIAVTAQAESPLDRYVVTNDYAELVTESALQNERDLKTGCETPRWHSHALQAVLVPPHFPKKDAPPVDGVWVERVDMDRCGTKIAEHILLLAVKDGPPHPVPLLPGTTKAGPLLQKDAMQAAVGRATLDQQKAEATDAKSCPPSSGFTVPDTIFQQEYTPIAIDRFGKMTAGDWDEIWVFRFCGRAVPVHMRFIADGHGGTDFTASHADRP